MNKAYPRKGRNGRKFTLLRGKFNVAILIVKFMRLKYEFLCQHVKHKMYKNTILRHEFIDIYKIMHLYT